MSLGWQTESALLPSKAKPIKVDNKSMVGLKSILLQQEQQRAIRLAQDPDYIDRQRQLNGFSGKLAEAAIEKKRKREEAYSQSNSSSHHDTSIISKENEEERISLEENARLALEAKSKLYDTLQNQEVSRGDGDNTATFGTAIAEATLIDFHAKKKIASSSSNDQSILLESSVLMERNKHYETAKPEGNVVVGGPQYKWSTGTSVIDGRQLPASDSKTAYLREHESERQLRIVAHAQIAQHTAGKQLSSPVAVSQGARVKSQWEKKLDDNTKQVAQRFHEETEQTRRQSAGVVGNPNVQDTISNINQTSSSSVHNERLELLKQKRERLLAMQSRSS